MYHYAGQLIDLLLVLVAAWMVAAIIFAIYAYFAGLRHPVSESALGRVLVISFVIITTSIWLPIIAGALVLSLIGHLWSGFKRRLSKNRRGNQRNAPFLLGLTIAAINIVTIATAAE